MEFQFVKRNKEHFAQRSDWMLYLNGELCANVSIVVSRLLGKFMAPENEDPKEWLRARETFSISETSFIKFAKYCDEHGEPIMLA